MSDQPPLASPSGQDPAFEQYAAPAWGQSAPEPGAGQPQAGPAPYPVGPPAGQPYQVAPQYVGHVGAPTHPLAVTSLSLGIVGLVLAIVCNLVGLIVSIIAYNRSKAAGFKNNIALAGIIVGAVLTAIGVLSALVRVASGNY